MNWWHNRSIRFKASAGIILILSPLLGIVIYGIARFTLAELWQREILATTQLNSISANLVSDAMMEGHKETIQNTIDGLGKNVGSQFDGIAIYDDQYTLTYFSTGFPGGRTLNKSLYSVDATDPNCWVCHQLPPEERPVMTIVTVNGQDVLRSVTPLYNEPRCQSCHGAGAEILGDSIVDFSLSSYQNASQTLILGLGISALAVIGLLIILLYQFMSRAIISPLSELSEVTQAMAQGELDAQVQVYSDDEVGKLGNALNVMASQVRDSVFTLEERVKDRTKEIEERSRYLEISAEVSSAVTSITDPEILITQVVELIKERFDLYYVGLFLSDNRNEWAIFKAGSGKEGKAMLDRKHQLKIGEGMIGWCIANAQARIALDVGEDAVRFENPDLPETRSEGALPLRSRGHVLGAITIQSSQPAAFTEEIITALQTMADQIAVALDNAELFARTESALEAERKAYGELSRAGWIELARAQSIQKYISDAPDSAHPIDELSTSDTLEVTQTAPLIQNDGLTAILPIKIRNVFLGGIKLRKSEESGVWTEDQLAIMKTLSEQVGIALESARLFAQAQKQAARERVIGEISSNIGATTNIDAILRSTVEELGRQLDDTEIILELENNSDDEGVSRGH